MWVFRYVISVVFIVQAVMDKFPEYSLTDGDRSAAGDYMHFAFIVSLFFEIPCLLWLIFSDIRDSGSRLSLLQIIGIVLYLLGDIIRLRAKSELGRLFTYDIGIREGHRLVTTGPYEYLIHPSYLGYAMKSVGLLVYFKSRFLLGIKLFLTVFLISRIFLEEEMLFSEFGEEFVKFRDSRWRMLPFVF